MFYVLMSFLRNLYDRSTIVVHIILILVGGTFALYSLLCRYAKVGLTPSQQAEDRDVSNFQLELPSKRLERASKLKSKLESSQFAKFFLLFATMLGTSMVIGDGVLTPCMSGSLFKFVFKIKFSFASLEGLRWGCLA